MNSQIFSQTMRTSARQTWYKSQSFGFTKGYEAMVGQVGSIVDCGNSVKSPRLHPQALCINL